MNTHNAKPSLSCAYDIQSSHACVFIHFIFDITHVCKKPRWLSPCTWLVEPKICPHSWVYPIKLQGHLSALRPFMLMFLEKSLFHVISHPEGYWQLLSHVTQKQPFPTMQEDMCSKCTTHWMPHTHHIERDTTYVTGRCAVFTLLSSINQVFYSQLTDIH
jgi:hypothetical protein